MKMTLDEWMKLKGVSGKELAQKTGITETTMSLLRRRKHKPRLDTVMVVADNLGISINDIEV